MTSLALVQEKIPQELQNIAMEYSIDDESLQNRSDLIILVLQSKSIEGKEEKQSWFSLLPVMDQDQISKLYDILNREQSKLKEIEQKYEEKKESVVKKFTEKTYSSPEYQNTISKIKAEEAKNNAQDEEDADKLLDNL